MTQSNSNQYIYHALENHNSFSISYNYSDPLVTGFTDSSGQPGTRTSNFNENFIGRPQIISTRIRERDNSQLFADTRIHTWNPYYYIELAGTTSTKIIDTFSNTRLHPLYGYSFYQGYNTIHHCYIFSEYLTDSELTKLGEQLSSDWNTLNFKI
jgi:hypothetical protein